MRGVPPDYYRRLDEAERGHWYHQGMERLSAVLLGDRLTGALLDAGCGTGGFLRFARGLDTFSRLAGIDVSAEAIDLARAALPEAELHVGPLNAVPFPDASFDLVTLNDVLQHIEEADVEASLRELRRVLRPSGALLVRTNGGLRTSRPRSDWRLYTRDLLAGDLERGGFRVQRMTYANMAVSTLRAVRGLTPKAPSESTSGIPPAPGRLGAAIGPRLLDLEARYLAPPGRSLPYGHTLLAVAVPS